MKGKSKVSLLFVYLNQFDHYTRIAVNLLQFNPELYYNTMYHHIFILKSLLFDSIHVSKELLPISDERIMRNCC